MYHFSLLFDDDLLKVGGRDFSSIPEYFAQFFLFHDTLVARKHKWHRRPRRTAPFRFQIYGTSVCTIPEHGIARTVPNRNLYLYRVDYFEFIVPRDSVAAYRCVVLADTCAWRGQLDEAPRVGWAAGLRMAG
jgi:hypothetical protein